MRWLLLSFSVLVFMSWGMGCCASVYIAKIGKLQCSLSLTVMKAFSRAYCATPRLSFPRGSRGCLLSVKLGLAFPVDGVHPHRGLEPRGYHTFARLGHPCTASENSAQQGKGRHRAIEVLQHGQNKKIDNDISVIPHPKVTDHLCPP